MKINLNIDESEKRRILEMHESATKKIFMKEQGTPPAAVAPAATGSQIEGKTYTIEKIINKESLNKFINWGTNPLDGEVASDIRKYDAQMANQLGFAYEGGQLPEKPEGNVDSEPVKKIKQVYADLDLIAQNYKLIDLCKGKNLNLSLQNTNSINIAKNRAMRLGWCRGLV